MSELTGSRWGRILRRARRAFVNDQVTNVAAGVALRVGLAVFPAIVVLVWISRQTVGVEQARTVVHQVALTLPQSSAQIVERALQFQITRAGAQPANLQSQFGAIAPYVSLAFMVWSANGGMRALLEALNLVFGRNEQRSFVRLTAISLALTAGLGVMLLATVLVSLALPLMLPVLGLGHVASALLDLARWPAMWAVFQTALSLLYRYAPNQVRGPWRPLTLGSAGAAVLLVVTSALFSWITGRFWQLALTYGGVSSVIGFLMWLWVSFVIVFAGAELDAAADAERGRDGDNRGASHDPARAAPQPRGQRR